MRAWLLVVIFGLSAVACWPVAKQHSDCNNDIILRNLIRVCAQAKRSTQLQRSIHFGKQRKSLEADDEEAMDMSFMATIQKAIDSEEAREIKNSANEEVARAWPMLWEAYRRVRQAHEINLAVRSCCQDGCSPNSLAGLAKFCPG